MEDYSNCIPNFLLLSGIYPKTNAELTNDLIKNKLGIARPKQDPFDKLPILVILDTWVSSTNLRCFYDGAPFKGTPIIIPITKKNNVYRREVGVYCSFSCAYMNIVSSNKDTWSRKENLMNLYNTMFKSTFHTFPDQLIKKDKINYYGGHYTLLGWRSENDKILKNELT